MATPLSSWFIKQKSFYKKITPFDYISNKYFIDITQRNFFGNGKNVKKLLSVITFMNVYDLIIRELVGNYFVSENSVTRVVLK